ncbi:hypothetical protein ACFQ60_19210 [Streptomyces zhihengii]
MGGTVTPSPRGLLLETGRVFANCPKYIQRRELLATGDAPPAPRAERERLTPASRRSSAPPTPSSSPPAPPTGWTPATAAAAPASWRSPRPPN